MSGSCITVPENLSCNSFCFSGVSPSMLLAFSAVSWAAFAVLPSASTIPENLSCNSFCSLGVFPSTLLIFSATS